MHELGRYIIESIDDAVSEGAVVRNVSGDVADDVSGDVRGDVVVDDVDVDVSAPGVNGGGLMSVGGSVGACGGGRARDVEPGGRLVARLGDRPPCYAYIAGTSTFP